MKFPVVFERRRYGRQTFTWAYAVKVNGDRVCLGDPWPCVTPKLKEIEEAVELAVKHGELG